MQGISVIVCSYNPEKEIFERVLEALARAASANRNDTECIVIDNNSSTPLQQQPYIEEILLRLPQGRIIVEQQQGLTRARIRGIREAIYDNLLFIDDDNEISSDYLVQAMAFIKRFPFIGAFNAGVIKVEYIGTVGNWFKEKGKEHFQESRISTNVWGNDHKSYRHWPFGTGMLVKKEVCRLYLEKVEKSLFTLTDRKGGILTSGGDGQLVSCALEMGYGVGRAGELKLRHLIAARKASLVYLTKMDYGIYYSNEWFLKECFPGELVYISGARGVSLFISTCMRAALTALRKRDFNSFSIRLAGIAGRIAGNRQAFGKPVPAWLSWFGKRYQ